MNIPLSPLPQSPLPGLAYVAVLSACKVPDYAHEIAAIGLPFNFYYKDSANHISTNDMPTLNLEFSCAESSESETTLEFRTSDLSVIPTEAAFIVKDSQDLLLIAQLPGLSPRIEISRNTSTPSGSPPDYKVKATFRSIPIRIY